MNLDRVSAKYREPSHPYHRIELMHATLRCVVSFSDGEGVFRFGSGPTTKGKTEIAEVHRKKPDETVVAKVVNEGKAAR